MDFYVPEKKWSIQVSFSIADDETRRREVGALSRLPKVMECEKRTIFTFDEESVIEDERGRIEVVPVWKWLLEKQ